MNILHIITVHDSIADTYSNPFYAQSTAAAVRSFKDEINNSREGNNLYSHPDDYDLYSLGTFNDKTLEFSISKPSLLARGKNLKNSTSQPSLSVVNSD